MTSCREQARTMHHLYLSEYSIVLPFRAGTGKEERKYSSRIASS